MKSSIVYFSLFVFSFSFSLQGEEREATNSIINFLQENVNKKVKQYNFIDEQGSHQLLYADEMVFKNIPSEWEDEVRNLFLVKVVPSAQEEQNVLGKSSYKSVEQTLMLDVVKARWSDGNWVKTGIEHEFIVGHPFLSEDGKRMFFISDMNGSVGGTDLFMAEKINGIWSEPIGLKYFTNSKENEYFPSISNNTLRYISKGKVTFIELSEFMHYVSKLESDKPVSKKSTQNNPTITSKNVYQPPLKSNTLEGVVYKIQLGLFRAPNWNVLNSEFSKYGNLENTINDGIINIKVGDFNDLDYVDSILNEIRKVSGFSSAFIVSYKNGRIISIDEARKLHQQSKISLK
jgi:hypothetical protein